MKNPLKQKRCQQCGWELSLFSRQTFCSVGCASLWDKNLREQEELQKERTRQMKNDLKDIREWRERQKLEYLKNKYEE